MHKLKKNYIYFTAECHIIYKIVNVSHNHVISHEIHTFYKNSVKTATRSSHKLKISGFFLVMLAQRKKIVSITT
jgi:hypothetical protein